MRKVLDIVNFLLIFSFGLFAAIHADFTAARRAHQANFTEPSGPPDCDCTP